MMQGEGSDRREGQAFSKRSIENIAPAAEPGVGAVQRPKRSKHLALSPLTVPLREFAPALLVPTTDSPVHHSPCSTPSLSPRPRKVAFRSPPEVSPATISSVPTVAQGSSEALVVNESHKFEELSAEQPVISRRSERGCRCGRTRCLKQYCMCFRADTRCTGDCLCENCYNDGKHETERAQAIRNIRASNATTFKGTIPEDKESHTVRTLVSGLRAVRGCRCRKSRCQKKYCECYGAGLKCSSNCQCEACKNGSADEERRDDALHKPPVPAAKPIHGVLKKRPRTSADDGLASSDAHGAGKVSVGTPPSCEASTSAYAASTVVMRGWRGKGKIGLSSCDWYHEEREWQTVVGEKEKWLEDEDEDEDGDGDEDVDVGRRASMSKSPSLFMSPPKSCDTDGKYFDSYGASDAAASLVRGESLLNSDEPVCTPVASTAISGMLPPPWACGALADDFSAENAAVPSQPCSWGLARNDSVDLVFV